MLVTSYWTIHYYLQSFVLVQLLPIRTSSRYLCTVPGQPRNTGWISSIQTDSEAHQASNSMGTRGSFPWGKADWALSWPSDCQELYLHSPISLNSTDRGNFTFTSHCWASYIHMFNNTSVLLWHCNLLYITSCHKQCWNILVMNAFHLLLTDTMAQACHFFWRAFVLH